MQPPYCFDKRAKISIMFARALSVVALIEFFSSAREEDFLATKKNRKQKTKPPWKLDSLTDAYLVTMKSVRIFDPFFRGGGGGSRNAESVSTKNPREEVVP